MIESNPTLAIIVWSEVQNVFALKKNNLSGFQGCKHARYSFATSATPLFSSKSPNARYGYVPDSLIFKTCYGNLKRSVRQPDLLSCKTQRFCYERNSDFMELTFNTPFGVYILKQTKYILLFSSPGSKSPRPNPHHVYYPLACLSNSPETWFWLLVLYFQVSQPWPRERLPEVPRLCDRLSVQRGQRGAGPGGGPHPQPQAAPASLIQRLHTLR